MTRHYAFFEQDSGRYVREWKGPVCAPPSLPRTITEQERSMRLNAWATKVSAPARGEVALDVTHVGWPVGDFCYCRLDFGQAKPLLDWGPPRQYIEVRIDTMEIVANWESHRPIRSAVVGQLVIDITGSPLAEYHGHLWGRFVWRGERWGFEPRGQDAWPMLTEASKDLELFVAEAVPVHADVRRPS